MRETFPGVYFDRIEGLRNKKKKKTKSTLLKYQRNSYIIFTHYNKIRLNYKCDFRDGWD